MPNYSVRCLNCDFESSIVLSIAELDRWDKTATCPGCQQGDGCFRRIIKNVATFSGAPDNWSRFASKSKDPEGTAAAFEAVKTGQFEGF